MDEADEADEASEADEADEASKAVEAREGAAASEEVVEGNCEAVGGARTQCASR